MAKEQNDFYQRYRQKQNREIETLIYKIADQLGRILYLERNKKVIQFFEEQTQKEKTKMSKNKNNHHDNEAKRREEAYKEYCKELAKANGVPVNMVNLLKQVDKRYSEIKELLSQVEEETGITDLENDSGQAFSELASDYANENGCMPYEELICILGQFHGRASQDK